MNTNSVILYKFAQTIQLDLAYEKISAMDRDRRSISVHIIYIAMYSDIHTSYSEFSGKHGYTLRFRSHRYANLDRKNLSFISVRFGSKQYRNYRQAGYHTECQEINSKNCAWVNVGNALYSICSTTKWFY